MKDLLPFGFLDFYFVCWWFTIVTVGRDSLPYLVWYRHRWKQLMCKMNIKRLTREYTILWIEFDLCVFSTFTRQGLERNNSDNSMQCIRLIGHFQASHWVKNFLPLGLLDFYFVWWCFTLVNVGRASLPYLVWYRHRWKQLRCKLNINRLTKEYTILWIEFDLCGFQHWQNRDKGATKLTTSCNGSAWLFTSKLATKWKTT